MSDTAQLLQVLLWSCLAVVGAWLAPRRWQAPAIIACGAGLLATVSATALALLSAGTIATFLVARRGNLQRAALIVGVAMIAATFTGFVMHAQRSGLGGHLRVILPLGMAFFSLRLIHYLFEAYKKNLRPHSLDEYACYHFIPSLLPIGPIHRFDEFLRDWRRRRWDTAKFTGGAERVLYGLVKIIVVGNHFLGHAAVWAKPVVAGGGMAGTYVEAVVFWLSLYVAFSGYSDLAIGFAAMMGIDVRENFDWPFLARNIADFWRRWHASLSSWCRDYVFVPVLSVSRRQWVAVVSSMVVLGLWHDVSLRYILWGAYHGAGISAYRWFDAGFGRAIGALPVTVAMAWRGLATLVTLHFVLLSFPITSALQRLIVGG